MTCDRLHPRNPNDSRPSTTWIQFAAGTTASETWKTPIGLKLVASTVSATDLKAYYDARGVPEPYLAGDR